MEPISSFKNVIKAIFLQLILVMASMGIALSQPKEAKHPVYPPRISNLEELKKSLEPLMKMPVEEIIAGVPSASGFNFVGCPNCNGGVQEGGLRWEPGMGDKVRCNYCGMVFPNDKFPSNREKVIIAPSGTRQVYRYYENPEGRQFFFEAHAWYERWNWMNSMADQLARLWYATKDNAYGDRAAAITGRFAQVFPDYAIRYDYPFSPKRFFPADQKWPYEGLDKSGYRGAKWDWWAYMDIPDNLTGVYDLLQSGYDWKRMNNIIGPETDKKIATDLLRLAYEFTAAWPDSYGNMSPGMYRDFIRLGRVLEDPAMVHEAVNRFCEFFAKGFFADGWWQEGTPSYHNQTIGGLRSVAEVVKGYTDPPDWKGERFENMNLATGIPLYAKAIQITGEAVLPDGRPIPINDTWARAGRGTSSHNTGKTISHLWPALGDAALGAGEGENQILINLNWSGNYGHSHYDNGSIILYASGQELLSDIGYTHGKYRGWTIHTPSHNLVVIDQKDQDRGKSVTGRLKFYDDADIHVKAIDLDASPAYPEAKTYRRRLVMVHAGPGQDYIVDRFDVEGGKDHDWFLHGMCEQEGTLETSISLDKPLEKTLVPDWGGKEMPQNEYETDPNRFHPYLFLRDVKTGAASEKPWTATWRYDGGTGLRTHIFSPPGAQIFRFRSPSIRPAGEDDSKLDNFMLNGLMQRNSGKASTFIAIYEPFRNNNWIESVRNDNGALVVRYKLNGIVVEDKILLSDEKIAVTSSSRWKYSSGTPHSGQVEALENANGKWSLMLDRKAPKVHFVRLDLSDGSTRYYPVSSVNGNRLELADDPGFTLTTDSARVVFHTFPKDKHKGPLGYTLFTR